MTKFYDDRAPPSPPRPRAHYRAQEQCEGCGVAAGEVHAADCPQHPRSGYIG